MPATDDRTSLRRAQAGDPAAFEAVVGGRLAGLWRLARALLGSDEAATEALTSTLLGAWRELPRLDDLERFDAWLERILLSECRMRLATGGPGEPPAAVPPGLHDAVAARLREMPPRPPAPAVERGWRARTGWVAAAFVLVVALAVTALGIGALRLSRDPATASAPDASSTSAGSPSPAVGTGASLTPSLPPPPDALHPGGLAIVTLDGDNLRVRSAPGTDDTSKKFTPLLPAATRMLVVSGPVEANGYEWWEVQTDSELLDLFGWVATGKDGHVWIAPTEPRLCAGDADDAAVLGMSRIDFLVCHGDTPVALSAEAGALWDARETRGECGGLVKRTSGCDAATPWLLLASTRIQVSTGRGDRPLVVAIPPDFADQLARLPKHESLELTVSMDSPEAEGCRLRNAKSGKLLLPPDKAMTICRLQFVVQEVAFVQ